MISIIAQKVLDIQLTRCVSCWDYDGYPVYPGPWVNYLSFMVIMKPFS